MHVPLAHTQFSRLPLYLYLEELVKAREEKTRFFAELTKASDEVVVLKKQLEVACKYTRDGL